MWNTVERMFEQAPNRGRAIQESSLEGSALHNNAVDISIGLAEYGDYHHAAQHAITAQDREQNGVHFLVIRLSHGNKIQPLRGVARNDLSAKGAANVSKWHGFTKKTQRQLGTS